MRHGFLTALLAVLLFGLCLAQQCTNGAAEGHQQQTYSRLAAAAKLLVAPGKGLLAADESTSTMGRRFDQFGIQNTPKNRAAWRQALLATPTLSQHVSGVILTEETFYQPAPDTSTSSSSSGSDSSSNSSSSSRPRRLVDSLLSSGIAVGVKVDLGTTPLINPAAATETQTASGGPFETQTSGLEGLLQRCQQYAADGATFAKWRSVLRVDEDRGWPSEAAVGVNARQLARFAAAAQQAGLVPLVEPEVLMMDGEVNQGGFSVSEAVSVRVLSAVVKALLDEGVLLEGVVLKPAMVLPGSSSSSGSYGSSSSSEPGASAADVAAATLRVLRRTLPPAIAGVAFLSGGQSEQQAAANLAAIAAACGSNAAAAAAATSSTSTAASGGQQGACGCPWGVTFSFGRALQTSALQTWAHSPQDVSAVQQVFSKLVASAGAAAAAAGGQGRGKGHSYRCCCVSPHNVAAGAIFPG